MTSNPGFRTRITWASIRRWIVKPRSHVRDEGRGNPLQVIPKGRFSKVARDKVTRFAWGSRRYRELTSATRIDKVRFCLEDSAAFPATSNCHTQVHVRLSE